MTNPVPFTSSDRATLQLVARRTEQIVDILLPTLSDPDKPGLVREVHDLGLKLDGHIADTHDVAEQVAEDARAVAIPVAAMVVNTASALAGPINAPPHAFFRDIAKQALSAALAFVLVGTIVLFLNVGRWICATSGVCS